MKKSEIKALAKWLGEKIKFLSENSNDYTGCWYTPLNQENHVICLLFEDGFDAQDEDLIHAKEQPEWCLVTGIKTYNGYDTMDGWYYPFDHETGDVVCDSCSVSPTSDLMSLAESLLEEYYSLVGKVSEDGEYYEDGLPEDVD